MRLLQNDLHEGRQLDIGILDETNPSHIDRADQQTNYICVDRFNILKSSFLELDSIENFFLTYEVDFMGETAKDYGGPRREWFRECNKAIKEKYFDFGLRDLISDEYFNVGILIATCLLQGGQLPTYIPKEILEDLRDEDATSKSPCLSNLSKGLEKLGIVTFLKEFPQLLHLLRPSNQQMTAKMLLQLLTPVFSIEGTKNHAREKEIYTLFVKYTREVRCSFIVLLFIFNY